MITRIKNFFGNFPSFVTTETNFESFSAENIPEIMANKKLFDSLVYTSLQDAYKELERRRKDPELEQKIISFLENDIPKPLQDSAKAVIFRHIATPNYELRRFTSLMEGFGKLEPLFWEYYSDKFTSNNECKRALGKLFFFKGKGKKGGLKIDSFNIIDFNTWNGKKISSVETLWGQSFVEFHHEFLHSSCKNMSGKTYDASEWFRVHGNNANGYYKSFISLFIRHGILFENFLFNETEQAFTEEVFLPAFISLHKEFGLKPLIVALEPTSIEGDLFWMCYPNTDRPFVEQKMATIEDGRKSH